MKGDPRVVRRTTRGSDWYYFVQSIFVESNLALIWNFLVGPEVRRYCLDHPPDSSKNILRRMFTNRPNGAVLTQQKLRGWALKMFYHPTPRNRRAEGWLPVPSVATQQKLPGLALNMDDNEGTSEILSGVTYTSVFR